MGQVSRFWLMTPFLGVEGSTPPGGRPPDASAGHRPNHALAQKRDSSA